MQPEYDRKKHWEAVYTRRLARETSWHQEDPRLSLSLLKNAAIKTDAAVIDVGGGASLLVDRLLRLGYRDLTVLDISAAALEQAQKRLGKESELVTWVEADVTDFSPDRRYDLWHDRAAFHFLTALEDRQKYLLAMRRALELGGQAIIAAFAPDGPEKCSGLEVVRYDRQSLQAVLGERFVCLEEERDEHVTPGGGQQMFGFYRFRKIS